jgi:hypothetical protein
MDIRRALTYLFADPRWPARLALAMALEVPPGILASLGLLTTWIVLPPALAQLVASPLWVILVSLAGVPVLGFLLRITRNVLVGADVPLPAWDHVSGVLWDGLKLWAVITTWSLPLLFLTPVSGPVVSQVITVIVTLVQPAAEARLAATDSLASSVDFLTVVAVVRRQLRLYFRLLVVSTIGVIVGFAVSFAVVYGTWRVAGGQPSVRELSVVATLFSLLILRPYGQFVLYHLYGQVYTPPPVGRPDPPVTLRDLPRLVG